MCVYYLRYHILITILSVWLIIIFVFLCSSTEIFIVLLVECQWHTPIKYCTVEPFFDFRLCLYGCVQSTVRGFDQIEMFSHFLVLFFFQCSLILFSCISPTYKARTCQWTHTKTEKVVYSSQQCWEKLFILPKKILYKKYSLHFLFAPYGNKRNLREMGIY